MAVQVGRANVPGSLVVLWLAWLDDRLCGRLRVGESRAQIFKWWFRCVNGSYRGPSVSSTPGSFYTVHFLFAGVAIIAGRRVIDPIVRVVVDLRGVDVRGLRVTNLSYSSNRVGVSEKDRRRYVAPDPTLFVKVSRTNVYQVIRGPICSFLRDVGRHVFFVAVMRARVGLSCTWFVYVMVLVFQMIDGIYEGKPLVLFSCFRWPVGVDEECFYYLGPLRRAYVGCYVNPYVGAVVVRVTYLLVDGVVSLPVHCSFRSFL